MEFSKYEATGNDFVMLDRMSGGTEPSPDEVRALCSRHTGIGADGVIVALPSATANVRMRVFNADGSEAEMCGNGVRALFLFLLRRGLISAVEIDVETLAGVRNVVRSGDRLFSIEMGMPAWTKGSVPVEGNPGESAIGMVVPAGAQQVIATCLSMGNPHCVILVDDVDSYPVREQGPLIENHPMFPERTNVEFVQTLDSETLKVRVWERGVGETLACGTGACAAAIAANLNGRVGRRVSIHLEGGTLGVDWLSSGQVILTGPARHVFDGKTVQ